MTIDINELRLLVQDYKLAGSPVFVQAADMNELLDRLELAESGQATYRKAFEISENTTRDLTEKVIPNIRNQLEVAEKVIALKERIIDAIGSTLNAVSNERDDVATQLAQSEQGKRKISEERDALQAKIEVMEKQDPVARFNWSKGKLEWLRPWDYSTMNMKSLYLATGAKGE